MDKLFVFHSGEVVCGGPFGLDLSSCERVVVIVLNLAHVPLVKLHRCIQQLFDRDVARNKIIIETVAASMVTPQGQIM